MHILDGLVTLSQMDAYKSVTEAVLKGVLWITIGTRGVEGLYLGVGSS